MKLPASVNHVASLNENLTDTSVKRNERKVNVYLERESSINFRLNQKWDKVFKIGPSKICGKQPLKDLKGYGLLKQTISLQIF